VSPKTTDLGQLVTEDSHMAVKRDPSPEEIAEACLMIQAGWSERERLSRLRVDLRPHYTRCDGVDEEFDADTYNGHHEQREKLIAVEARQ
jgi:hypothetical protein